MDEQRYGLSYETIVKVEELKRLVHKYPQYQDTDPNVIVEWAIYCCMNGGCFLIVITMVIETHSMTVRGPF